MTARETNESILRLVKRKRTLARRMNGKKARGGHVSATVCQLTYEILGIWAVVEDPSNSSELKIIRHRGMPPGHHRQRY